MLTQGYKPKRQALKPETKLQNWQKDTRSKTRQSQIAEHTKVEHKQVQAPREHKQAESKQPHQTTKQTCELKASSHNKQQSKQANKNKPTNQIKEDESYRYDVKGDCSTDTARRIAIGFTASWCRAICLTAKRRGGKLFVSPEFEKKSVTTTFRWLFCIKKKVKRLRV